MRIIEKILSVRYFQYYQHLTIVVINVIMTPDVMSLLLDEKIYETTNVIHSCIFMMVFDLCFYI